MYTVKHAAELTGIPADTLRMWERRYAVVAPDRSDSGYRLYDDAALRRLEAMHTLVDSGWSPAPGRRAGAGRRPAGSDAERPSSVPERGDVLALARVASSFDVAGLDAALDAGFALGSFEEVVDGWLMPALHRVGAGWREGSISVAGEHLVSATVQRRIAAAFDAPSGTRTARPSWSGWPAARATSSGCSRSRPRCGAPAWMSCTSAGTCPRTAGRPWSRTATRPPWSSGCPPPRTSRRCARRSPCWRPPGRSSRSTSAAATSGALEEAHQLGHALGPAAEQLAAALTRVG